MICVNKKQNAKLLETFNNDPYYDIIVHTYNNQLHLVIGYLSIDSQYFNQVSIDAKQINLSHLPQTPLIKILRALYGEELWCSTVGELNDVYQIIQFLQVHQYKENIVGYIVEHPQLMDSLELIQFCFNRHILQEQIKDHHFKLELSVLASTKNYLQLNKISQNTLNTLLLHYLELKGDNAHHTINSILQNYLGRNDIPPSNYFMQPGLSSLQIIWEKFHHSLVFFLAVEDKVHQSQFLDPETLKKSMMQTAALTQDTLKSVAVSSNMLASVTPFNINNTVKNNYQKNNWQLLQKDKKILELEGELSLKKQIICKLKQQIEEIKKESYLTKSNKFIESDEEVIQDTKIYKRQRQRDYNDLNETTGGDYEVSLIEPAFNHDRKVVNDQAKPVKTMNKLNERARKIFN